MPACMLYAYVNIYLFECLYSMFVHVAYVYAVGFDVWCAYSFYLI